MLKRLLIAGLLALAWAGGACAQTTCSQLPLASVLSPLADNVPSGSITPRMIRDAVCSTWNEAAVLGALSPLNGGELVTVIRAGTPGAATTQQIANLAPGGGGGGTGVTSYNGRTGVVTGILSDVTSALGYTPPSISGTPAVGNCVKWVSSTQIGDQGTTCGTGGGGGISLSPGNAGIVMSPNPIIGSGTISTSFPSQTFSGSHTFVAADLAKITWFNSASAMTATIPQATGSFGNGAAFCLGVQGTGGVTLSPQTSTIYGIPSLNLAQNQSVCLISDGTNWGGQLSGGGSGSGSVTSVAPGQGISTTITAGGSTPITSTGTVYLDASYQAFFMGGCQITNDGGSPNTVLDVSACVAASDDSTVMMKLAAFTKTLGAWTLGSGNGCLDTGAVANATWYHVFEIERTDTGVVDVLCSTNVSSPTFPASYSKKRRLGSVFTCDTVVCGGASTNIAQFKTVGNITYWATAPLDVNTAALGTTAALQTLAHVPPGVKVQPICRVAFSNAAATTVLLTSPDETDVAPATGNPFTLAPGWDLDQPSTTAAVSNGTCPFVTTNTSQQVRARASNASTTLNVVLRGWAG